jgi:predicted nucleotidyltransferase
MTLQQTTISQIQNFFHDKPVKRAYLFGSFARNEADEQSDIDILVELDYSQHIGLEFIGMKLDLEDMLKRKVDLVSERALSKYIRPYVEQEKKLIYEK